MLRESTIERLYDILGNGAEKNSSKGKNTPSAHSLPKRRILSALASDYDFYVGEYILLLKNDEFISFWRRSSSGYWSEQAIFVIRGVNGD